MSRGNVHLSIHATSNLKQIQSEVAAMHAGLQTLNKESMRLQQQMLQTGRPNEAGINRLSRNMASLRNDYNTMASASGQYFTATRQITAETTKFNEALGRQKLRLRDVVGQHRLIKDSMREQMALNNMAVTSWRRDATGKIDADIFVPRGVDIKNMSNMRAQLGYYNQVLRSVSQGTLDWGKNTQWAGRQLTVGFTVPISIAMGFLARFAYQADAELVRIVKVYGDAEGAFQASSESIRNMAQETAKYVAEQYGIAANETRDVMAELAATGMEGSELQGMTGVVQRLSMLGEMSSGDSLRLARILKEVYGATADEVNRMVNYFNAIENSTALTMQDITEGIPRIAGIMKATGVSVEEQTELLVAFKSAGIDVAEGANALKSINFKAVAATPTAANAFMRITGESMQDLIDKTEGEFIPTLLEIAEVMENLDQQSKVELIARVFGIHQGSRAITLLEQLREGSEGMLRAQEVGLQSAEEHARAADKEIKAIQESMSNRLKRMGATARVTMESIGEAVLEVVVPLAEVIIKVLNWIDDLDDGTKRMLVIGSVVLGAAGIFIMFIGLMGNLVGMTGKGVSALIGLIAPFKLLVAESKAAQLLQQMFGKAMDQGTAAVNTRTAATKGLTAALLEQNKVYAAAAYNNRGANVDPGVYSLQRDPRLTYGVGVRDQGGKVNAAPGLIPVNQSIPWTPTTGGNQHSTIGILPSTGRYNTPVNATPDLAAIARAEAGDKAAIAALKSKQKATADYARQIDQVNTKINGMARGIGAASGAMFGLAMITKNETLQNISLLAMGVSSILPLMTHFSQSWVHFIGSMGVSGGAMWQKFGRAGQSALTGIATGARGLMTLVTGPFGLALAAAGAAAWMVWNRHKKQMEEIRGTYEDLADSSDELGRVYGYMPTTQLEREAEEDPDYDNTNWGAHLQRVQDMKSEADGLYDTLKDYARYLDETVEGTVDKTKDQIIQQEMLNEAIVQGAKVMRESGDPERAKLAAWDIYNTLSEEFLSYDDFEKKLKVTLDGKSLEDALNEIDNVIGNIAQSRVQGAIDRALSAGKVKIDTHTSSDIKKNITQLIEQSLASSSVEEAYQTLSGGLSEIPQKAFAAYNRALEADFFTPAEMSYTDFIKQLDAMVRDAELHPDVFGGASPEELATWQLVLLHMEEYNNGLLKSAEYDGDVAAALTGRQSKMDELIGKQENLNKEKEIERLLERNITLEQSMRTTRDPAQLQAINDEIEANERRANGLRGEIELAKRTGAELYDLEQQKERNALVARKAAEGSLEFGLALGGLGENASEATGELEELSAEQQKIQGAMISLWQDTMSFQHGEVTRIMQDQFNAHWDGRRKAQEAVNQGLIDDIESEWDGYQKSLDAYWKGREKAQEVDHRNRERALRDRHEQQNEALSLEKELAQEALADANDAEKKALDARREANREQQKLDQKALKESQEARRAEIEAVYDVQIERINKQIEAEDRLEKQRQKAYENERNRISRMRELFSDNISLNMAINTGDMDEAARVANDMRSKQSDWALQDLASISGEESDQRREALRNDISDIEDRKQAELDAIKEVEEAEEEALERKYKRMEDELAAEREKLDAIYKENRKALDNDFKARQKELKRRQEADNDAMRETLNNEKETLNEGRQAAQQSHNDRRDAAVNSQKEINDNVIAGLEEQRAEAQRQFNMITEHWAQMNAENFTEQKQNNANMVLELQNGYTEPVFELNKEMQNRVWDNTMKVHDNGIKRLKDDIDWEANSARIADQVMRGIFGVSMTPDEIGEWVKTGMVPQSVWGRTTESRSMSSLRGDGRTMNRAAHSGGIAGVDSSWTGPGYTGKSQEIDYTLLEGEGILNLRAMNTPGVKEMMYAANQGELLKQAGGTPRRERPRTPKTGDAPIFGAMFGSLTGLFSSLAHHLANQAASTMLNPMQFGVNMSSDEMKRWGLGTEQLNNASAIISTGRRMGASERDIIIALMTAMQESSLRNINYGDDIYGVRNSDGTLTSSLGLFQQQKWWGSVEERMNPARSAELFFEALFGVGNRNSLSLSGAAQAVQRSAFPNAYAKWEDLARSLLSNAEFRGLAGLSDMGGVYEGVANPNGLPWQAIWQIVRAAAPEAHMTSNYRPGSIVRGTNMLSYHAMGRAIDIVSGNMPETFRKVKPLLPWTQLIYTPMGGSQMYNGRNFMYTSPITKRDHYDHIHLAYKNGGTVGGLGQGDVTRAMLEPGEFVVRKTVADRSRAFLEALNGGEIDFAPVTPRMGHRAANFAADVDSARVNEYTINMEFGPVTAGVDVERAVHKVLRTVERRRPQSRSV